jgi:hypothetical protein
VCGVIASDEMQTELVCFEETADARSLNSFHLQQSDELIAISVKKWRS